MKTSMHSSTVCSVFLFCFGLLSSSRVEGYPARAQMYQATAYGSCASAGFTSGCCISSSPDDCRVSLGSNQYCYCDQTCHAQGAPDCCDDINTIGCYDPTKTCRGATLDPGCCTASSCYVPTGTCYCDSGCRANGDCCIDVDLSSTCPTRAVTSSKFSNAVKINAARTNRLNYPNRLQANARAFRG